MIINPHNPTRAEIAASYALWMEYVDPSGIDTRADFDAMNDADKKTLMDECFGPDIDADTVWGRRFAILMACQSTEN